MTTFPYLPKTQLVDNFTDHQVLRFMDTFFGYNQILIKPSDQENTAFITELGLYYYKVMPFGLKNIGATYRRLINRVFYP